jgi:hypothetical protein
VSYLRGHDNKSVVLLFLLILCIQKYIMYFPRQGRVEATPFGISDGASTQLKQNWKLKNDGHAMPGFDEYYKPIRKASDANPNDKFMKARVHRYECSKNFCGGGWKDSNGDSFTARDLDVLCHKINDNEYVPIVLPWQRTVVDYMWSSRRSVLLSAGTGVGKSVVAAYAIDLVQFGDTQQGGFLGKNDAETNIGMIMFTSQKVNATGMQDSVLKHLGTYVSHDKIEFLKGMIQGSTTPIIGNLLQQSMGNTTKGPVPGRLYFGTYGDDKWGHKSAQKRWNQCLTQIAGNVIVLDEVHLADNWLLHAISESTARVRKSRLMDARLSSSVAMLMTATPCGGGVLKLANILRALDNSDTLFNEPALWATIARDLTNAAIFDSVKRTDVMPLLIAMGLTLRSVVSWGDKVRVAGGSKVMRVVAQGWWQGGGMHMVELENLPGDDSHPGDSYWCPSVLVDPVALNVPHDVQLFVEYNDTGVPSFSVYEEHEARAIPRGRLSRCTLIAVPSASVLDAATNWDAMDTLSSVVSNQSKIQDMINARYSGRVHARALKLVSGSGMDLDVQRNDPDIVKTEMVQFARVTSDAFLGHSSLVDLEETYMYPTARFTLEVSRKFAIPPSTTFTGPQREWLLKWYPDCDVTACSLSESYDKLRMTPEKLGGFTSGMYPVALKSQMFNSLKTFETFVTNIEPWMPLAMSLVFSAAAVSVTRKSEPSLFKSYLVSGATDGHMYESCGGRTKRASMWHRPGDLSALHSKEYRNVRTAIACAQYLYLVYGFIRTDTETDLGSIKQMLNAIYPKYRSTNVQRQVVYVSDEMRSIAEAIAMADGSKGGQPLDACFLAPFKPEREAEYIKRYHDAMTYLVQVFFYKLFNDREDGDLNNDLRQHIISNTKGTYTGAEVMSGAEFEKNIGITHVSVDTSWQEAISMGDGSTAVLIISDAAGAVGTDYAEFQALVLLTPCVDFSAQQQLLGRVRRLQGQCTGSGDRVANYLVVVDSEGSPDASLMDFKTLAKPVGSGTVDGPQLKTAWDLIEKSEVIGTQTVNRFELLDFVGHAKDSLDCARYLRMTMAGSDWRRMVASSAHSLGVLGPKDMAMEVSEDVSYYETLAEPLDALTVLGWTNALKLNGRVPQQTSNMTLQGLVATNNWDAYYKTCSMAEQMVLNGKVEQDPESASAALLKQLQGNVNLVEALKQYCVGISMDVPLGPYPCGIDNFIIAAKTQPDDIDVYLKLSDDAIRIDLEYKIASHDSNVQSVPPTSARDVLFWPMLTALQVSSTYTKVLESFDLALSKTYIDINAFMSAWMTDEIKILIAQLPDRTNVDVPERGDRAVALQKFQEHHGPIIVLTNDVNKVTLTCPEVDVLTRPPVVCIHEVSESIEIIDDNHDSIDTDIQSKTHKFMPVILGRLPMDLQELLQSIAEVLIIPKVNIVSKRLRSGYRINVLAEQRSDQPASILQEVHQTSMKRSRKHAEFSSQLEELSQKNNFINLRFKELTSNEIERYRELYEGLTVLYKGMMDKNLGIAGIEVSNDAKLEQMAGQLIDYTWKVADPKTYTNQKKEAESAIARFDKVQEEWNKKKTHI